MSRAAQSTRERIHTYLCEEVLPDPQYQGQFLTEDEAAALVGGVSRTPVREAFLLLAAEGLIDLVPRHGAFIPAVSLTEIHDTLEFRAVIEVESAGTVLAEGRVPAAAMREAWERQAESTDPGLERAFLEHDRLFHMALVEAAGNALMTRAYRGLRTRQARVGAMALVSGVERQAGVLEEHLAILTALESGDLKDAQDALVRHVLSTARVMGVADHTLASLTRLTSSSSSA